MFEYTEVEIAGSDLFRYTEVLLDLGFVDTEVPLDLRFVDTEV